ncbi:MAG TPA: urease accessory protein UreD [Burkholderiales bacterium]|nr:urease accessory protein UreD [Burkholderiales bacterium]
MHLAEPVHLASWRAQLALGFERRGAKSVLAARRHDGPLALQKPLYPEGEGVCHAIVLHPPGGIAGGDVLEISARVGEGAHALLTTPGAGKWYRSAGPWARQSIGFEVARGACLEWLPQETIVFAGALAGMKTEVRLDSDARFIGWEILCLGRTGSGERFARGACRLATSIERDGKPLWHERGRIEGGSPLLESAAGLRGEPVAGTLLAAAPSIDDYVLAGCRSLHPHTGEGAVTRLPGLLVARYLGASSESARNWFIALWRVLRPALVGREAIEPRIWRT